MCALARQLLLSNPGKQRAFLSKRVQIKELYFVFPNGNGKFFGDIFRKDPKTLNTWELVIESSRVNIEQNNLFYIYPSHRTVRTGLVHGSC